MSPQDKAVAALRGVAGDDSLTYAQKRGRWNAVAEEVWQRNEAWRTYMRSDYGREAVAFTAAERRRAVHLAHNDGNAQRHPGVYALRYLRGSGGTVYSVYSPNFEYIAEVFLGGEALRGGGSGSARNRHFAYCNRRLLGCPAPCGGLSAFDREFLRLTGQPYDTV